MELRTPLRTLKWPAQSTLGGFVFFDAATLRLRDPLPGQTSRFNLAGSGLGVRYQASGLRATLQGAWALKRTANTGKGDLRAHFELRYDF